MKQNKRTLAEMKRTNNTLYVMAIWKGMEENESKDMTQNEQNWTKIACE